VTDPPVSADDAVDAFYEALLDDDPEALYERAPCGYLSTSADGTIIKVNQTFLTLTGYQRSELVGRRRFVDLLTPGGRIYHETHYAPSLQMQGSVREIAVDLVRADGQRFPALVNSVLERRPGVPVVVRTAVFDATHRREYERELLRAKEQAEASERRANALARTLQQTFVPPLPPEVPGLDVAAGYRPAGTGDEVGGDFYDVFQVAADRWTVVIGDVCGKGVEAAVVTALARHTIRARAMTDDRPSSILATLNSVLLHEDRDRFCTVVVASLERVGEAWSATVCSAGHAAPLLARGDELLELTVPAGFPVGLFDEPPFLDATVQLLPGDRLVFVTDGVVEGRREGEFFGDDRLADFVRAFPGDAAELVESVLSAVVDFQGGRPRDDIAIVAVSVPPPSA
jgi:phosphoserine phosphatase RsbU/P